MSDNRVFDITMTGGRANEGFDGGETSVVESKDQNYNDSEKKVSSQFSGLSPGEVKRYKFLIMKNVVVISISFMLLFTAFQSMAALQSSINKVRQFDCDVWIRKLFAQ